MNPSEYATDFLVIGSGIAGLVYALDASQHGKVLVLSKAGINEGNTRYAQGGIASVTESEDSFEFHIQDTLQAGAGLCNPQIVREVIEGGPLTIDFLTKVGVRFDCESNPKNYSLGKEGGHSKRRILHWGDETGAEILRALLKAVTENENITLLSHHFVIDLITSRNDELTSSHGAYVLDTKSKKVHTVKSAITCLATGGIGKVYLYTSNPDVATGDGIAIAYRAGAQISNMEFVQFHPTCLYDARARNFLVTEAMRGEGALLKDMQGYQFMKDYHPDAELAPRDIVARAIDDMLKKSGDEYVYLDITHLSKEFLSNRFPNIFATLLTFGINISEQMIPVVPAAHYSCGGISCNSSGATNITNLYAIGEVSCSGLHGANRLASNSLLEAVVLGRKAAKHGGSQLRSYTQTHSYQPWDDLDTRVNNERVLVSHLWDEVRRTMWNLVGIVRTSSRLRLAEKRIDSVKAEIQEYYWRYQINQDLLELRNITEVAQLIINMAIQRKESRGLHFNTDFPETLEKAEDSMMSLQLAQSRQLGHRDT